MNNNDILEQLRKTLMMDIDPVKKLTIGDAYDNFINHAKINCREETIKFYNAKFSRIYKYFINNDIKYVDDINKRELTKFVAFLKSNNLKNSSVNKYVELIKSVVKYNFDNDFCMNNNILGFKKLKEDKSNIKIIEKDNIKKILRYINNLDFSDIYNVKKALYIYLLYDTGARINEILNIKTVNVDINNNQILLDFTKTKDFRMVYITDVTVKLLKIYIDYLNENVPNNIYLLCSFKTGNKLAKNTIYEFLDKLKKELNINQSITPHKWRHTMATELVEADTNLYSVMTVLGHTSLETTKKYLHVHNNKIKSDTLKSLEIRQKKGPV